MRMESSTIHPISMKLAGSTVQKGTDIVTSFTIEEKNEQSNEKKWEDISTQLFF